MPRTTGRRFATNSKLNNQKQMSFMPKIERKPTDKPDEAARPFTFQLARLWQ